MKRPLIALVLTLSIAFTAHAQEQSNEDPANNQRLVGPTLMLDPQLNQGFELSLVPYLSYRINNGIVSRNLLSRMGVGFRQITDEALRKQLELNDNEGLVVVSIEDGSIADDASLSHAGSMADGNIGSEFGRRIDICAR